MYQAPKKLHKMKKEKSTEKLINEKITVLIKIYVKLKNKTYFPH